jgi:hypothetical protein
LLERVVSAQCAAIAEVRASIPEDHVILYVLRIADGSSRAPGGSKPLALPSSPEGDGSVIATALKLVGKSVAFVARVVGAAVSAGLASLGVGSYQQPNPGPPPSTTDNREYRP